ncbi:fimbrial protein [Bordetella holmesii]|nr:fimbrial protein [Bordetella holmesii]EWM45772.1 fimbrial family protein [Bordetella holmesii 70147]EWM48174.1 fimbrial family protein [Bordetella holmesii 41130]KCV01111.1 fimbrial protein [Bordetella holmesii CDC-H629-BH]KCV20160.1 fimbrial protein [Bordetella holmesii CDC-H643-BH]QGB08416.1 fimbrial protein [Bordetella holmesii]
MKDRNSSTGIECVKAATATLMVAGMMTTPPAYAVDGTITISGEITDQTCKINGNQPPYNLVVTLPKIGTKAIPNVNDTAGATPFEIKLSECPDSLNTKAIKAYFEPGLTTDSGTGNLKAYSTTAAATVQSSIPSAPGTIFKSVQIQLANPNGATLKVGVNTTAQAAQSTTVTNKAATLRYLARYIRTSSEAITAGKLVSYVQYSIVYP